MKNKINRKDPFKSQISFSNHDMSSYSGVHDEIDFSKHETPGWEPILGNFMEVSKESTLGSNKPLKAIDKHIYGAVPFEYRPGQVKKSKESKEIIK